MEKTEQQYDSLAGRGVKANDLAASMLMADLLNDELADLACSRRANYLLYENFRLLN